MDARPKLAKNLADRKLSGVCAGLGDYFRIDANIIRLVLVLMTLITGGGVVIAYVLAALLLPARAEDKALGRRTSVLSLVFLIFLLGLVLAVFMR
jgi:phage shock protein PspC (stress-responsive transcriptional regulator)